MSILLSIETATHVCSVALTSGGRLLALRETNEKNAHSKLLAVYVDEVLKEAGVKPSQLAGVAVSEGPGSYTDTIQNYIHPILNAKETNTNENIYMRSSFALR